MCYAEAMDVTSRTWFRRFGIAFLAVVAWPVFQSRHGLAPGSLAILLAAMAVWVAALLGLGATRLRSWSSLALALSGAALTRLSPDLSMTLLLGVGVAGFHIPWRWLRYLGLPLVIATALWLVYPHWSLSVTAYLDLVMTVAVIVLVGRQFRVITDARAAQAEALAQLELAHARLKERSAAAEELAALRERMRLARELHDTLGHALSAIAVQMEAARRLAPDAPPRVERILRETQAMARGAMADLRHHVESLRAPRTAGGETVAHLARAAARRNGWRLELQVDPELSLSAALPAELVQVAREALTNAERHARASRVEVRLWREGGIRLLVADDGCGFDPREAEPGHYGLEQMVERMAGLGGNVRVTSAPGRGTRVEARLPEIPAEVAGLAVKA